MTILQSLLTKGTNVRPTKRLIVSSCVSALLALFLSAASATPHTPIGSGEGPPPEPYDPPPCPENTCCEPPPSKGDPVDLYNGRLFYSYTDLTVNGVMSISMTRRYDNHKDYDSPLGYGWGFTYDQRLYKYADGSAVLRIHCGQRIKYESSGGGYVPPEGVFYTLTDNGDGTNSLLFKSGRKEHYDAEGRLTAMVDPQGNQLEMLYDPAGKLPLTGASPYSITPDEPKVVAYDYRLIKVQERLADGSLSGNFVDISYAANNGRVTKVTASDGREVSYAHDNTQSKTHGNLLTVTGLAGLTSHFLYNDPNDAHNISSIQVGASTTPYVNTFDNQDRVIKQTHGNDTFDFDYVIPGMETEVTQTIKAPNNAVLHTAVETYEFNERGDLLRKADALGHEMRTVYNSQYRPITSEVWQKTGNSLSLYQSTNRTFDSDGNKLTESVTLDSGETITTSWTYYRSWVESSQTVSSLKPQEVFRTEYTFYNDSVGDPVNIKEVKRKKADGSYQTTQFAYDAQGRVSQTTLPDGVQKAFEYTGDFLTKTYYKVGGTAIPQMEQRFAYDARGNRNKIWDANNNLSQYEHDDRGRVIKKINALGQEDIYTYLEDKLVQIENGRTQADGEGQVTRMSYDGHNNLTLVEVKDDDDNWVPIVSNTFDSTGNQLSTTDAEGRISKTNYDALNRAASMEDAIGNITQYTYDAAGNQAQMIDALNRITEMTYDDLNRLVKTEQQAVSPAAITQFSYNAEGGLLSVTDPESSTTAYEYDRLSRRTKVIQPLGQQVAYEYDSRDRLVTKTGARQQKLTYAYYPWGPMQTERHFATLAASTAEREINNAYDNNGNLTSITDNGIKATPMLSYAYDALNRPESQTAHYIPGGNKVITRSFDRYGNQSASDLNDGSTASSTFAYNKRNHLTQASLPGNQNYTFDYFNNSDVKTVTHPSGLQRNYVYQANGPVKDIHVTDSADSTIDQWQYTFDAVLNIKTQTDSLGQRDYNYDGLDHLTQATYPQSSGLTDEDYEYDKVGNRQTPGSSNAYQYDDNHRLIEVNGVTLSYDDSGNLINKSDGTNLAFDSLNRLGQYTKGTTTAGYQYNSANQRLSKTVGGVTTWFLYNGSSLIAEYDDSGSQITRYDYLPYGYTPAQVKDSNGTYEVQVDHLDTPRLLIDQNEQVVWRSNHQAFGATQPNEDVDGDGVLLTFNFRFPGQYYDSESGLFYNWNRYYDPKSGRYITSDPIGLDGGINYFNYTDANPLTFVDAQGLAKVRDAKGDKRESIKRNRERRREEKKNGPNPPPKLPKAGPSGAAQDGHGNIGDAIGDLGCAVISYFQIRLKKAKAKKKIEDYASNLPACVEGCSLFCVQYQKQVNSTRWCIQDIYSAVGSCPLSIATAVYGDPWYIKVKCDSGNHVGEGMCCG